MKKLLYIILSFSIICFISILLGEVSVRLFLGDKLRNVRDVRNLMYRYDAELGWFPIKNDERYYAASKKIFVKHNSEGFRDHEHGIKEKNRIVFLGDSFVWGYDVEQEERFTEKLQKLIPGWEVINLGICGYGTDQEYLLIKKYFDFYKPDIVFLVFSSGDIQDNLLCANYNWYFKPYFIVDKERLLQVRGVPVPKSAIYYYNEYQYLFQSYLFRAIVRGHLRISQLQIKNIDPTVQIIGAMNDFLNSSGAIFIVGFIDDSLEVEAFCKKNGIRYLSLNNPYRYPGYGKHWTPEGHDYVNKKIYDLFSENKLLDRDNQ